MGQLVLTGTQTAINLAKAFAGESQARTRYLFYSEVAKKAGYPTLEEIFLETDDDERGHAEKFFEYLMEGLGEVTLEPNVLVPVFLGTTAKNLIAAAKGEFLEWSDLYPGFGRTAKSEGFDEIATSFFKIASVERRHDARFRDLAERLRNGMLFESCHQETWQCANCGYRHVGTSAPKICPACHHGQEYFAIVSPCIL